MPGEDRLYPVNLVLAGRRCLVVGGGQVAAGKVAGLIECGAVVHVVAPEVAPQLRALEGVTWEERRYRSGEVRRYRLVIAATDDPEVNRAVFLDCEVAGVLVNSVDDPANCTFTVPSRLRRGSLLVTFSTDGRSPAVSSWMRRRFEAEMGPEYGLLVELAAQVRSQIQAEGRSTEGLDWHRALDSGMLELIREGRLAEAKERLQACLSS